MGQVHGRCNMHMHMHTAAYAVMRLIVRVFVLVVRTAKSCVRACRKTGGKHNIPKMDHR